MVPTDKASQVSQVWEAALQYGVKGKVVPLHAITVYRWSRGRPHFEGSRTHLKLELLRTTVLLIPAFVSERHNTVNICKFIYLLPHVSADYYGHHQVVSRLHKNKYTEVEASAYKQRFPLCTSFRTTFFKAKILSSILFPADITTHVTKVQLNDKNTTTRSKLRRRGQCYQLCAEFKPGLFPPLTIHHIPKPRLGMHEEIIPLLATEKHFYGMMLNYAKDKLMFFSFIIAYLKTTVMSLPQLCLVERRCH